MQKLKQDAHFGITTCRTQAGCRTTIEIYEYIESSFGLVISSVTHRHNRYLQAGSLFNVTTVAFMYKKQRQSFDGRYGNTDTKTCTIDL
jgi:predicted methyltransferase